MVVTPRPAALAQGASLVRGTHRHKMEQLNGFPGFPQNNKAMQTIKGLKMTPMTHITTEHSDSAKSGAGRGPAEPVLRSRSSSCSAVFAEQENFRRKHGRLYPSLLASSASQVLASLCSAEEIGRAHV